MPKNYAIIIAIMAALTLAMAAGCRRKGPDPATASLDFALKSLCQKDWAGFFATVVPAQLVNLTNRPEWPFFRQASGSRIDRRLKAGRTASTETIAAEIYFGAEKRTSALIHFRMRRIDDRWCIDMSETIAMEKQRRGHQAFTPRPAGAAPR